MDLSKLNLFKMTHHKMGWLSARQAILAENIANADTPKYRARDLEPINFERELKSMERVTLARTSGTHQESIRKPSPFKSEETSKKDLYEVSPTGNAVVLEEQLMKESETNMQYRLTTNIYQKHVQMMKMAIGAPGQR